MVYHKAFVLQCQALKLLSSVTNFVLAEITKFILKFKLSQLNCFTGNFGITE